MSYPYQQDPYQHPGGPYPNMPYPNSSSPYQAYPGGHQPPYPTSHPPHPGDNDPPYPSHGSGPYPSHGGSPYPSHGSSPYPSHGSSPYPSHGSSPYPNQGNSPYPSQGNSPYPCQGNSPYPSQGNSPYPSHQPAYPNCYPGQNNASSPYPTQAQAYPPVHAHSAYATQSHAARPQAKGNPTVRPAQPFNRRSDAEVLRKAMKGFGTDEKAIIDVLANRSNAQRLEIEKEFKTLYGKDLIKELKSELSGRFEDLVLALMMPPAQFLAREVHKAVSGIGTDEDAIVEALFPLSNQEVRSVAADFQAKYGETLESALKGDTAGTFKRLLVSLCTANRAENQMADPSAAMADAQSLLRAGELRLGTDESVFNAILCQRSYEHLKLVFAEYERMTGRPFEQAIDAEFSGDARQGLLAIVKCVKDRSCFFAERLRQSMEGAGTNDKQLIRIVVARSEIDLGDIKKAYQSMYGRSLDADVANDTSGDYKKCLLALIAG